MGKKLTNLQPRVFFDKNTLPKDCAVVEAYTNSLHELFFITHPAYKKEMPETQSQLDLFLKNTKVPEIWIYYPALKKIIHTVDENTFFQIRTARNRNIITEKEQIHYRNMKVGIIGLSIGSAIVSSLVATGGPKRMKLADHDTIELSNLNRMHATLLDIGRNKSLIAAERVWSLDPFAELDVWDEEVTENTIEKFILRPKLDVFIDSMDSLSLKVFVRLLCRKHKIPVLMTTSNGDSIILDVERFDLDNSSSIFHGRLGDVQPEDFRHMNYREWLQLATKIVDPSILTERMQESSTEIRKTIAAVPQLGTTVNLGGASISYILRRIANKQALPSGRYVISLEEKLIPGYNEESTQKKRLTKTKEFIEFFTNQK